MTPRTAPGGTTPPRKFTANAAWVVIAALAHNLLRRVARLGFHHEGPVVAKTLRQRIITVPRRLTRSARAGDYTCPTRWPWAHQLLDAITRLGALPTVT